MKMRRVFVLGLLVCVLPLVAQAGQRKKHSVTLKWNAPVVRAGQTVVGYNIYRSDKENGQYKLVGKGDSTLTFIDVTVKSGNTYYYKVTSIDAKGRESTAATTKASVP